MTPTHSTAGGRTDYADSKPHKGERGSCVMPNGDIVGFVVSSIEGNLCFANYDNGDSGPFIWRFNDGLNIFHTWPSKARAAIKTAGGRE
jgi:hypothetical protein